MKIKVFGMDNCTGCVTVKTILKENCVEFTEMDVMNPDHMAEAQSYGVRGVPTTIVDKGGVEQFFVGSTQQVLKQIREAVGI